MTPRSRRALTLSALLAVSAAAAAPALAATPPAFTAGDVVVYRVGDGSAALSSSGTAVFLDEYSPAGALVQSVALPTAAAGANQPLTASGSASSEGQLTRSVDGRYLLATGYGATVGTASVAGTASTAVPRVVGRVDSLGTVDTTTALSDFSTANNPRSATSTDGTTIWVTGGAGGVRSTTLGSTTSTQLSTTVTNLRDVVVAGGQLYVSTSSGSAVRVGTVGTGTPTAAGQTITNLPGFPTSGSPYQFAFADLSTAVAGVDTLYVADDTATTGGVQKYSLVSGSWTLNGTMDAGGLERGLTLNPSTNTLYATRNGSTLVSLADTTGYNVAPTATATLLATAGANQAFRGVALAPTAAPAANLPEAPSVALLPLLGVAVVGALVVRRRLA